MKSWRCRSRSARLVLVYLGLASVTLSACTGGSASPEAGRESSAAVPSTSTETSRPVAETTPRQVVTATVIDTPPELLPEATTTLAVEYTPSSGDVSTVLQAVVPEVTIFAEAGSSRIQTVLTNPLPSGAPLTFLADGQTPTRYKVLLPIRPNGSTGWVDPSQVKKFSHSYKIVVEIKAKRITVFNGPDVFLTEEIATGKNNTPTPNGRYYLKELLKPCYDVRQPDGTSKCIPKADGPYGPFAYGLSGFSPVVTNFNGGEGVLGIHGTDRPELLGTDVSFGCIRMSNTGITLLSKVLPLGTPVVVRP